MAKQPKISKAVAERTRELQEANEALRASEERHRRIVETAVQGIWLLDADARTTFVNPRMAEMLGCTVEEMRGKALTDFMDEEAQEEAREYLRRRQGGIKEQHDFRFRHKDGSDVWTLVSTNPVQDDQGRYAGALGMVTDITDRKQAEDLVRIQRDLGVSLGNSIDFRDVLRLCLRAGLGASEMDCGGIYVVDRATGALDLLYHEALPEDFVTAVAHYDAGSPNAQMVMAGDPIYTSHRQLGLPLMKAEDEEELKAIAVVPVKHANRVVGCLNVASHTHEEVAHSASNSLEAIASQIGDAIANRQAEEALREEGDRAQKYLDIAGVMFVVIDADGAVGLINRKGCETLGYKESEIIGKDWFDCFVPERIREQVRAVCQGLMAGDVEPGECHENPVLTRDGDERIIAWHNTVLRDERGDRIGTLSSGQDITDRRRAERQRDRLICELEAKNAELERFTYTVSHDLKGPLITIQGFVGLLERDVAAGDTERTKDDLSRIHAAAGHMESLLGDLLELSRIGRVANPPTEVSLADVAREAVDALAETIARRGARVEIADGLPVVFADRPRLVEVLQNLVENAVKFSGDRPEPVVEIGMREDGGRAVLFVRDDGIGIDQAYTDKVFGLFDQLDPGVPGTGAGLAIARRIVEVHGGRIWVESDGVGQGSTFCFTLPHRAPNETEKQPDEA